MARIISTIIIAIASLLTVNVYAVINHFANACFTPLIAKVDTNNNVFLLYYNKHPELHCQDLSSTPYNFVVFELYGLDHDAALKVYTKYNTLQTPIAIKDKLQYFQSHHLSCHIRGRSTRWPFTLYYGCIKQ